MASMNPVLRLRRAFRSMGATDDQAEDAVSAIDEEYVGRSHFDARMREQTVYFERRFAELRQDMADMRNQMMVTILVATGLILTAIIGAVSIAIAMLD